MGNIFEFFKINLLCTLCILSISSCASRGYTLSQQIPNYDNNLEPIKYDFGYKVDTAGEVHLVEKKPEPAKAAVNRSIASEAKLSNWETFQFTPSTLDKKFGAVLIGKSANSKSDVEVITHDSIQ
jgi:hypothetical protein